MHFFVQKDMWPLSTELISRPDKKMMQRLAEGG